MQEELLLRWSSSFFAGDNGFKNMTFCTNNPRWFRIELTKVSVGKTAKYFSEEQ
jgi:hypothetical protein